jgi:DMSO/TMAO reductase YedYZ heme-binding membrane subunit
LSAYPNDHGKRRAGPKTGAWVGLRGWDRALATAILAVVFGCLYFFVRQFIKDGIWRFDLMLVNKSLGVAALTLLSLSMFLTGWSYFTKRNAGSLARRAPYGLTGFWLALAHVAVNHFLLRVAGLSPERSPHGAPADAAGLAALAIFAAMTLISNDRSRKRLGPLVWRKCLRYTGYAGLVLAVGHAALLKWGSWTNFFRTFNPALPSLSLPAALIAASAVVLRLAMWIAKKRKD